MDYNPGRYIRLEPQRDAAHLDIRDFQALNCAPVRRRGGQLTGSDDAQYSEIKFLQVKKALLIASAAVRDNRSRTGAGQRRVTDLRNWFLFAASERWRADDSEDMNITRILAENPAARRRSSPVAVLAASLAYQFGLEWGAVRSRSFRFVVIDEAFGRGSDESAQYGLRMGCFVAAQFAAIDRHPAAEDPHHRTVRDSSVGFVHNPTSMDSQLRTLTIEEYRAERLARTLLRRARRWPDMAGGAGPGLADVRGPGRQEVADPARRLR